MADARHPAGCGTHHSRLDEKGEIVLIRCMDGEPGGRSFVQGYTGGGGSSGSNIYCSLEDPRRKILKIARVMLDLLAAITAIRRSQVRIQVHCMKNADL